MTISARLIQVLCVSIGATVFATDAHAQDDAFDAAMAHVGVGAGINFYRPTNSDLKRSDGLTIAYRWHSFHSGWGPTFGLDWHSSDLHQTLGSIDAPIGSLRMRALLVGVGHTKRLGRFAVSASLSGGYSFNHLTVDSGTTPAFTNAGISLLGVRVNDSAMGKPDVGVWYDIGKHIGVGVSAAYQLNRPQEILTTATGSTTRNINANTFVLTTGLVFGVWKKPN
jgi:hypothetical protein